MAAQIKTGVLFIVLLKCVFCANILYIAPLASPSHYLWNKGLSLALVNKGHNVTILTPDSDKAAPTQNYTVITMEGMYDLIQNLPVYEEMMHESALSTIKAFYDFAKVSCHLQLNTNGLDVLLHYPEDYKFDLIIFDVTFGQCLYPLIDRFNKPPIVAVTAFMLPPTVANAFGNHLYTSYMPYYNTEFTNKMSYIERIKNFVYTYTEIVFRDYFYKSTEYNLGKEKFGDHIRTPQEVERSMNLVLSNTDPVLDYPMALAPNIIPIGGMHIKPPQSLPQDLQDVMDKAKKGVILFSLGTNIKFDMLKLAQRQAFFKALSKLEQTVFWKIESNDLEGVPKNVVIRKWFPQNDILGHPNLKLFISHGGALSTQEAMYHGIPVVAIPFIIDQYVNTRKLVDRKVATYLDHANLTPENVHQAIREVLENPIYARNMKVISQRYRDQPQTALERAIFWIEYVLRHGTAEHLVLPARDMSFYQTSNLDVLAAFLLCLFLFYNFMMLVYTMYRFVISVLRSEEKTKTS